MDASSAFRLFFVLVFLTLCVTCHGTTTNEVVGTHKMEIYDGVFVKIPEKNTTKKLISFEVDTHSDRETGRGKQKKLMQRILPLFIMPFVIQSTIIPLFLGLLKFMLFKSLMIGKLALVLIIINAFRNNNSFKGRQDADLANAHYGYNGNGMEEYGSYIN